MKQQLNSFTRDIFVQYTFQRNFLVGSLKKDIDS